MNPQTYSHPELIEKFPNGVKTLFHIFGDDIRLVGGSIRDLLLFKEVSDFDFATRLVPQDAMKLLSKHNIKSIPTGIEFGTITAVIEGANFEITTLRSDENTDGRHCEAVFVSDYFFDAKRRDFTINALYSDAKGEIYDYFDGIDDLKNNRVKFVGDAEERIKEDFLRILRFFRFSSRYSAEIDVEGFAACVSQKDNIHKLSRERIRAEILKMIDGEDKNNILKILNTMKEEGILSQIFSQIVDVDAFSNLLEVEKKCGFTANLNLKIAVLFLVEKFDLKIFVSEICATNAEKRYLKYFNDNIGEYFLTKNDATDLTKIKDLMASLDKELVLDFYIISNIKNRQISKNDSTFKNISFIQDFSLPKFPLNGQDVMSLGFQGKEIGIAISRAKRFWIEGDFKYDKSMLIDFIKTLSKH